jgi:serine-type D-Ala-D-Ala carboxypeptidase/endopeptidase
MSLRLLRAVIPCLLAIAASVTASAAEPFAAVDAAARQAFETRRIHGMGLAIYDRNGRKVFDNMYGDFAPDKRVAIMSASKLVSGVTLFRLIDQGRLSLDSTTAQILGWTGEKGTITLRHLLSFTSGLAPENRCTLQADIALAQCVDAIYRTDLVARPGAQFNYGSTHLAVAGRMAEVATGKPWNVNFSTQVIEPLGLPSDLAYYAKPRKAVGTTNPLLAGGLQMSMNEYAPVLRLVFDKGKWHGRQLLAPDLFDEQARLQYPDAAIGKSPTQMNVRYGLTAWLECATPRDGCAVISSPGALGFTPWIDRKAGYYAILGMQFGQFVTNRGFGTQVEQKLQPLIVQAMATLSHKG